MRMMTLSLGVAGFLALAGSAFAAPLTIAVQAPEGLAIKVSTATQFTKDIGSTKAAKWADGHYIATFSGGMPAKAVLVCAKVTTPGWLVVFPDGATTDKVCFPPNRLSGKTVGGKQALVLVAKFQKT